MSVTLTAVIDPARATPYESVTNGSRLVAVKFTITGVSGTFSSDANIDASVIGNDAQTYSVSFNGVQGCTNFNGGSYSVTPGHTSIGCVVFEVPNSVKLSQVTWGGSFGGKPAVWDV
jgi:hypothetical protein